MAEEVEEDSASWAELSVTLLFTSATSGIFLVMFEVLRRNPLVSSVFDSRRKANPSRTPPPLMRSRYFEWLFLSTDPAYTEHAEMVHTKAVIEERRRQQKQSTFRLVPRKKADTFVNEIEEEEMPKKLKKKKNEVRFSPNVQKKPHEKLNEEKQGSVSHVNSVSPPNLKDRKKEEPRSLVGNSRSYSSSEEENDDDSSESSGSEIDETKLVLSPISMSSDGSKGRPKFSFTNSPKNGRKEEKKRGVKRSSSVLTPDVVIINGRRLPASIAEYAIAGDLTDEQLDEYEKNLLDAEIRQEEIFKKKQREMLKDKNERRFRLFKKRKGMDSDDDDGENNFAVPSPPGRIAYLGIPNGGKLLDTTILSRFFPKRWGSMNDNDTTNDSKPHFKPTDEHNRTMINRHLKRTATAHTRTLTVEDQELLRSVGLDTFVMLRFLRFGFDTTFYPFLVACFVLIPTYFTNNFPDDLDLEEPVGYFRVTMNRLESGNHKHWVSVFFAVFYYCFILRRLWVEWETFIPLRFDFLAHGEIDREKKDQKFHDELIDQKDDKRLHLKQYQNSCLVQFIPESHRRDQELYQFFDILFPNSVKRAEILLNATQLTKLINQRQKYIVLYENIYAKQHHANQVYRQKMDDQQEEDIGLCHYLCCRCFGSAPKKPIEIKVKQEDSPKCCCGKRKMVKALPYYLSEIKRLNMEIKREHRRITKEKQKVEDKDSKQEIFAAGITEAMKFMRGVGGDLNCDTGFVEFKNLTTKQTALQCNITGTTDYMVISAAPEPSDVIWENMTVEMKYINIKKLQIQILLIAGLLGWSVVVTAVTSISNLDRLEKILPRWLIPTPGTFWYGLVQGYLPVVLLELLMIVIPIVLNLLAKSYIKFKTNSEVGRFVFIWHFGFRIANLVIIILKNQFYETIQALRTNPEIALSSLARGISVSSQFFLNNMIVEAGTANTLELAQIVKMIEHLIIYTYITVEAKSQRALDKLKETACFDWGEVVPPFIFAFLVAVVYCTIVPLILGACSVFFFITTKVYVHQALFCYQQLYEGGGTLMYLLNRSIFVILYIGTFLFSILLGLKKEPVASGLFLILMNLIIIIVDRKVMTTFVTPSLTLALTNARIIDEASKRLEKRIQKYQRKVDTKRKARRTAEKIKTPLALQTVNESSKNDYSQSKIHIEVRKEDNADQIKQRRKEYRRKMKEKYQITYSHTTDDKSDDSVDGRNIDFYLYRQPQLNTALWETKPRAYR